MIERKVSAPPVSATEPGATLGAVWRAPFGGVLVALLLLAGVEAILHSDAFLYRYRSVFAAGRAMDKLLAFEAHPTAVLALGNSRVDNGISPEVLRRETGLDAFNLGLPGAEACNIEGVVARLERHGAFSSGRTRQVLIGLDDGYFQRVGGLGYEVFFDDRARLLAHGRHRDWLRSVLRLWGYADSLRTLQEPAKLIRAVEASFREVESWGGNARRTAGFRAADEAVNQDASQIEAQNSASRRPPDPEVLACFWATTDRLQAAGVKVQVFFTPSLRSANAFDGDAGGPDNPYGRMKAAFRERDIGILEFDVSSIIAGRYFANPGHLNREGATRFTAMLSAQLGAGQRLGQGD